MAINRKAKLSLSGLTVLGLIAFGIAPANANDPCDPMSQSWVYTQECDVEIVASQWSTFYLDVGQTDGRIDYGFVVNAPSGLSEFSYICGEADPVRFDSPGTVFGIRLAGGELSARTAFVRINNQTTTFPIQAAGNNKSFSLSGSLVIPRGTNPFEGSCTFEYLGALTRNQTPSGGDVGVGAFSLTRSTILDQTPPRIDWELDSYSVNTTSQDARVGFSITSTDNVSLLAGEILCQEAGYVQRNGFSEYSEDTGNFDYSGFEAFASDDIALSFRFKGTRGTPFTTSNLYSSSMFWDRGTRTNGTATATGDEKSTTLRGSVTIPGGTPAAKLVCIGLTGDAYSNVTLGARRDFTIVNSNSSPVSSASPGSSNANSRPMSRNSRAAQDVRSAEATLRGTSGAGDSATQGRPNVNDVRQPLTTASGQLPQVSAGASILLVEGVESTLRVQQTNVGTFRASTADGMTMDIEHSGTSSSSNSDLGLSLTKGKPTRFSGSGFAPRSKVVVWLFSEPTKVGEIEADSNGNLEAIISVPAELEAGEHTLQISGQHPDGSTRALVIGVSLQEGSAGGSGVQGFWIFGPIAFLGALLGVFMYLRRQGKLPLFLQSKK